MPPKHQKVGGVESKRRRNNLDSSRNYYLSKGDIRKIARRGGVKRLSSDVYPEALDYIQSFLETIIKDTLIYMSYAKRKTVIVSDVLYAVRRHGKAFIGFDDKKIK